MNLLSEIQRARKGEVITVPFKYDKLSRYIFLGRGLYHLIGGAGGSGKSAWTDLNYVLNPALWQKKIGQEQGVSIKIMLRSLERNKERRKAKWVCMKLFSTYGILIDTASLLGWGQKKSRISDELYEKIVESYDWVNSLEDIVEVVDGIEHPTGIYKHFQNYALSVGKLYYYKEVPGEKGTHVLIEKTSKGERKVPNGTCTDAKIFQPVYVPDDPTHITISIVDHLQAMKNERGLNDKQNLDLMSEYARKLRDLYGQSPIIVNQMNRGISDTYRRTQSSLLPEDKDFAGSSNMFNDCDVAAILFNPYKYKVNDVVGWKPNLCSNSYGINRFRSLHLLKNTYGPDNQIFAYQFIGENGLFHEMPSPEQMTDEVYKQVAEPRYTELIVNYTNEIEQ